MKPTKCLNPMCKRVAISRGLCGSCYTLANRYIKRGLTTWPQLEREGKALPLTYEPTEATKWLLS